LFFVILPFFPFFQSDLFLQETQFITHIINIEREANMFLSTNCSKLRLIWSLPDLREPLNESWKRTFMHLSSQVKSVQAQMCKAHSKHKADLHLEKHMVDSHCS
jgi:hypothetical protein